jgi:hypothetical protein
MWEYLGRLVRFYNLLYRRSHRAYIHRAASHSVGV